MTPKKKAKELVYKYEYLVTTWDCYNDEPLKEKYKLHDMKKCALIAVDEILKIKLLWYQKDTKELEYWQEVKQEIELI